MAATLPRSASRQLPRWLAFVVEPYKTVIRHRGLLLASARGEVQRRYAGSLLGVFWVLLGPALLLSLYTLIYTVVFRFRPTELGQLDYVLHILCGLVAFLGFTESLQTGVTSVSANREVLLNTVFPAELLPVRAVLVGSVAMLVGIFFVLVATFFVRGLSWTALLVPLVLVAQMVFVTGLVWFLSLLNLLLRDIQQFVAYLSILLLIASPIAYLPSMLPDGLVQLIYLNPLAYFVITLQRMVIFGELPDASIGVPLIVMTFLSAALGLWFFRRAKLVFADA